MMVCVVYCVGKWCRVGVNSIPELGIGIGIDTGGIENWIGIENSGIGIENQNWIFCNCYYSINKLTNNFQILA